MPVADFFQFFYKLPESDISARIIVRMRKLERIDHDVTAFMSI